MTDNEFDMYRIKICTAIGTEYHGCGETEERLTQATGYRCTCYDEYIDNGCDESEADSYVMCASFEFEGLPIIVRIYYGDCTFEIGNVEISED